MDIDEYRRERAWEREEAFWWGITFRLIYLAFRLLWWLAKQLFLLIVLLMTLVAEGLSWLARRVRQWWDTRQDPPKESSGDDQSSRAA
jgi:hypothetical protein